MSVMDHKPGDGGTDCLYCCEPWPCDVAKVRRELAAWLRSRPVGSTGDADYDNGRESGIASAIDSIDI